MVAERTSQDSGFTLLEVVVALAIAALAIVGLFQAGGGGLLAFNTAGRVEEAVQLAQSHLAAVGRSAALIQGEFTDDDGGGYHWRLRARPVGTRQVAAPAGNPARPGSGTLFAVEVAISCPGPRGERSVVLKTMRLSGTTRGE